MKFGNHLYFKQESPQFYKFLCTYINNNENFIFTRNDENMLIFYK